MMLLVPGFTQGIPNQTHVRRPKLVTFDNHLYIVMAVLFAGFLCLSVGYANRRTPWGLASIFVGLICLLGPLAYKVYVTFN